jgi:hypothetical protein
MRAVLGWLRRRAQLEDVADGRGGAVAVIQRFGGALNLNVHIHALVLDGVFAKDRAGPLVFHPTSNLTALDVAEVLATVAPGIARLLNRRGIGEDADSAGEADAWTDEAPVLAGLAAASVQGRVALGRQRGARLRRLGVAPDEVTPRALGRCHARAHGCDLHAGLVVPAGQRVGVSVRAAAARGAGPAQRHQRGPRAAWRADVVPREATPPGESQRRTDDTTGLGGDREVDAHTPDADRRRARGRLWADLMRRTFGCDVLACSRCGGRLRLIALIDHVPVVQQILRHLGLPSEVPKPALARAPPPEHTDSAVLDFGA